MQVSGAVWKPQCFNRQTHRRCSRTGGVGPLRGRANHTCTVLASAEEEAFRDKVKNLTRLFYAHDSSQPVTRGGQQRRARQLKGSTFHNVPLWRVEWAVLPGMQEILHVLAPHYVHMFEAVFSRPRPWLFGHLYLPGGSKALGSASHSLASGSQSPLVGVLMGVTRAVRLRDGKFLLLASALGRFQVVRCCRELPYSEADVMLLEDCEVLEGLSEAATAAVLQAAPDAVSVSSLMAASSAAAREAAAALHWTWLRAYELKVAARQEWPGPGPREGENDHETYFLVQELAEQGVADVLPLPDGVVIGRCNLQQVSEDAAAAVNAALQEAAAQLDSSSTSSSTRTAAETSATSSDGDSSSSSSSSSVSASSTAVQPQDRDQALAAQRQQQQQHSSSVDDAAATISSLNTTSERGVALQGPETCELTASTTTCGSCEEVLMLEAAVWQQLDILAALSTRVKGRRQPLPFGLLQLRPPRPQLTAAAAAALSNKAAAAAAAAAAGSQPQLSSGSTTDGPCDSSSSSSSAESSEQVSSSSSSSEQAGSSSSSEQAGNSSSSEQAGNSSSSSSSMAAMAGDAGIATAVTSADQGVSGSNSFWGTANADGNSSSSSSSSSSSNISSRNGSTPDPQQQWAATARYAFAASEGMDVHADPLWPPLRRAAKLSYAAALVTGQFEADKGDMRQALLETPSIAARLRFVLAVLQKHAKVLAALAAVKEVQE